MLNQQFSFYKDKTKSSSRYCCAQFKPAKEGEKVLSVEKGVYIYFVMCPIYYLMKIFFGRIFYCTKNGKKKNIIAYNFDSLFA